MSDPQRARGAASARLRNALAAGTLGLASVFVALGLGETGLRALGLPFGDAEDSPELALCRFDPELGWSYIPGLTLAQDFEGVGRVVQHFDRWGARVATAEACNDPDRPSVLFVGCSYTMGQAVAFERTFVGRLATDPSVGLQMVNLGVQGYGTDQALLQLRRHLRRFSDVRAVVYTFLEEHVARNAYHDLRLLNPENRTPGMKPCFTLANDGTLRLAQRPRLVEILSGSRVGLLIGLAWKRVTPPPTAEVTRALVLALRESAEGAGATFLVVDWQQGPPPPGGRSSLDGLPIHSLSTRGRTPPDWDRWVTPDGHPDARAHALAAALIREELQRLGVLAQDDGTNAETERRQHARKSGLGGGR